MCTQSNIIPFTNISENLPEVICNNSSPVLIFPSFRFTVFKSIDGFYQQDCLNFNPLEIFNICSPLSIFLFSFLLCRTQRSFLFKLQISILFLNLEYKFFLAKKVTHYVYYVNDLSNLYQLPKRINIQNDFRLFKHLADRWSYLKYPIGSC